MAQPETAPPPEPAPAARSAALDGARLEQFLALQTALLETGAEPQPLAERFAQAVALFLGIPGAAVATVEDGLYRLLGSYGTPPADGADAGVAVRDALLAKATPRPLVLPEPGGRRTIVLPFRHGELVGGLHLTLGAGQTLPDEDLQLGRALALIAGVALTNARQCRRLAQLAGLKGDALAAMAHDLRAPLNALVGYTSLLAEGVFGPLTDEQRSVCATLERQAVELVDLLGATLDVARLENGRMPLALEEFALGDLLEALATGTFARARRDGRLEWTLSASVPPLRSDRVKLKQILQNLIDNALKYGGGRVGVDAAPLAGERVRITVRDTGPGIEADVLAHMFEPFRPGARQGTGFGLYLVRRLAEALGGQVAAHSAAGEGTALWVELPLDASRRTEAPRPNQFT